MTIHGTTVLVQRVNNVAKHAGMRFLDLAMGAERSLAVGVMGEAEMLDASRLIEAIRLLGRVEDGACDGAMLHV
jgi:hypothetical protein